jgi:hypothetical protein
MSPQPTSPSPDLQRLVSDGYEIEIRQGYLLLHQVPYLDQDGNVARGTLVSSLQLAGDIAVAPTHDHTVHFTGSAPYHNDGTPIDLIAGGGQHLLDGLTSQHLFSHKPPAGYPDYYEKMTTYVSIISAPAQAIDPAATAVTHGVVRSDETSVFKYMETASSRAGVSIATSKLRDHKIAIVGLGGTGGYILDLVAKTPVAEIHLYDGDVFLQHNAFRSPGAASLTQLRAKLSKVDYFKACYSPMRRKIVAHAVYIDDSNVDELSGLDFVFLCLDDGKARRLLVERLQAWGIAFVDVGMGVYSADDALGGQVRVTTSTPTRHDHVWAFERIPFAAADDPANQYRNNVQIADLNMLNAALAVIRWKKLCGFYVDLEGEHHSVYDIDGNFIHNEDTPRDAGATLGAASSDPAGAGRGADAAADQDANVAGDDDGDEQIEAAA